MKVIRFNIARFWPGATPDELLRLLVPELLDEYRFEVSDVPEMVLYGPYNGELPPGRYVKVFIGCENIRPLLDECDWAFGPVHEDYVNDRRYMRLLRWGDGDYLLWQEKDWDEILRAKQRFCIFLYSHQVYYREAFCRALSRYKHVDAPGRSLNNMPSIDRMAGERDHNTTLAALRQYKFVIAFENSTCPGYVTEKLTNAVAADSLPIYWGDPEIQRSFNVKRMINAHQYLRHPAPVLPRLPYAFHSTKRPGRIKLTYRKLARRLDQMITIAEQRIWAIKGFDALIDHVIEVDSNDELYLEYLRQPLLIGNRSPDLSPWLGRWREILESV